MFVIPFEELSLWAFCLGIFYCIIDMIGPSFIHQTLKRDFLKSFFANIFRILFIFRVLDFLESSYIGSIRNGI